MKSYPKNRWLLCLLALALLLVGCGSEGTVPAATESPSTDLETSNETKEKPMETEEEISGTAITLATWNIGHFSGGEKRDSTITNTQYSKKLPKYQDFIKSLNADILSLNEYSAEMVQYKKDARTKTALLSDYATVKEGDQRYFSCNALCSKIALDHVEVKEFDCNQGKWADVQINPRNGTVKATQYYYIEADLTVDGKLVKVVSTHLAFQGIENDPLIKDQVDELIAKFASYDRVILMGDWNSEDFPFFKAAFEQGGFRLANESADVVTYPSEKWVLSLDNFAYKGVHVDGFQVMETDLSDHYAVVCRMVVGQ